MRPPTNLSIHQQAEQKDKPAPTASAAPLDMKPKGRKRESLPGSADPRIYRAKKTNVPRRSIRLDTVHPRDMNHVDVRFFCDDCSHYSSTKRHCTIGFVAQHTRENQMKIYNLTGKIAFCRFIEID
jgi:hypothetical protein